MKADSSLIQDVSPVCKGKCLEVFLNNKQNFKLFSVIRSKVTWYGNVKKKRRNDLNTLISYMLTTGACTYRKLIVCLHSPTQFALHYDLKQHKNSYFSFYLLIFQ